MTAPSAWTIQTVMSIAMATAARLEQTGAVNTDEAALMDALRAEVPDVDVILLRLLRAEGEAKANREAADARIADLFARRSRYARQAEAYRAAAHGVMDALGWDKWKHAEFSASIRDGKPGVVITDKAALPAECFRVKREVDKAKIRELLEAGTPIPGAEMGNAAPILTVRTK
jgi:hypothetical protein